MRPAKSPKRVLCLWLPDWSVERLGKQRPELRRVPLVIYEEYRTGSFRVVACSPLAAQQGVRPGMSLSEASALTKFQQEKHDPLADRVALRKLAEWCEQFSPAVAVEEPNCLLMDVTGLAPLFGSEPVLVAQMLRAFKRQKLNPQIAVTDTYAAAWALTHFSGRAVVVVPAGDVIAAISPLSVSALNLPEKMDATLKELGIDEIGQLLELPRDSLAARFDPILLTRLDQATGRLRESIDAHHSPPEITAEFELEGSVTNREVIETVVVQLLAQVTPTLIAERKGIAEFTYEFLSEASPKVDMTVRLYEPTANHKHLSELALLQLEQLQLTEPVSGIRLLVGSTALLKGNQLGLFEEDHAAEQQRQLSLLVDRLSSRLEPSAVLRPVVVADAQAEFAYRYQPLIGGKRRPAKKRTQAMRGSSPANRRGGDFLQRPIRLLSPPTPLQVLGVVQGPPRQFYWRGENIHVHRTWGPERIETGWWRGSYVRRDYYRVETVQGNRYWLFRRPDGQWFLHGIFD